MVDWFCNTCLCIYLWCRLFCIFQKKKRKAACCWLFKLATFVSMWRHQLMLVTGCGWRYTSNNWLFVVACFQGRQLLKCLSLARTNQPCKKKSVTTLKYIDWWRCQAPKRTGHHVSPRMGQNSPRWNTQVFYLDQNPWWICGLLSNPRCYFQGRTPQRFQRKAPTTVVRVFFRYAQTNDETNKDTETKHRISRWRRMFSIWILRLSQKFDLTKRRPC